VRKPLTVDTDFFGCHQLGFDVRAYMSWIAMARALLLCEHFAPRASRPWYVFGCGFAARNTLKPRTLYPRSFAMCQNSASRRPKTVTYLT
jgi:hypothetical protein